MTINEALSKVPPISAMISHAIRLLARPTFADPGIWCSGCGCSSWECDGQCRFDEARQKTTDTEMKARPDHLCEDRSGDGEKLEKQDCTNNYCIDGWIWKEIGEFPDGPCPDCRGADQAAEPPTARPKRGFWKRLSLRK